MKKKKQKKELLTIRKGGFIIQPKFIKTPIGWLPVDKEAWELIRDLEIEELKELKKKKLKKIKKLML